MIENVKSAMSDNKLADNKSKRELILKRYRYQALTILVVFAVILVCAYFELIDKAVTGTLLGTTVGSVLKFPYQSKDNDKKEEKDK